MAASIRSFLIETRDSAKAPREVWAQRIGTKKEALATATKLLEELRETDRRAMVWLDGRAIRLPRKKEGREQCT